MVGYEGPAAPDRLKHASTAASISNSWTPGAATAIAARCASAPIAAARARSSIEDGDGIGLGEAGQVVKVGIGPVAVRDVVSEDRLGSREEDGDAFADRVIEALAPPRGGVSGGLPEGCHPASVRVLAAARES